MPYQRETVHTDENVKHSNFSQYLSEWKFTQWRLLRLNLKYFLQILSEHKKHHGVVAKFKHAIHAVSSPRQIRPPLEQNGKGTFLVCFSKAQKFDRCSTNFFRFFVCTYFSFMQFNFVQFFRFSVPTFFSVLSVPFMFRVENHAKAGSTTRK